MRAQSHLPIKKQRLGTVAMNRSGRQDSSLRPSTPKAPSTQFATDPTEKSKAIAYELVLIGFILVSILLLYAAIYSIGVQIISK